MLAVQPTIEGVLALDPAADALEFEGRRTSWGPLADAKVALKRHLAPLARTARLAVLMRNRPDIREGEIA